MTRRRAIRSGERYKEWLEIIAGLMQARGMTQDDLAARSQLDASNISRYFSGHKNPSIPSIAAISAAVEFDVEVALRLTRVLPPKHDEPDTEALLARAESAIKGMPPGQRRVGVELLERLAQSVNEDQRPIIGRDKRLLIGPPEDGTA